MILRALKLAVFLACSLPAMGLADKLVLISPHWEGIRYEFERAFKARYQKETGRTVELDWIDGKNPAERGRCSLVRSRSHLVWGDARRLRHRLQ
jgi:hypothetical protein